MNLNDTVTVKLTHDGEMAAAGYPFAREPDGRIRCELWLLLAVFGHRFPRHPSMLTHVLFENNEIEFFDLGS